MTIDRNYLENLRNTLSTKYNIQLGRLASNVYNLGDNIFYFNLWNLLPNDKNDILCGHYIVVVNSLNFNYFIYQDSYYGGLTYTTESKDKNIYLKNDLPLISKDKIDLYVADYLLGSYFFEEQFIKKEIVENKIKKTIDVHVNYQGKNLFPTKYCITNNINDYGTKEKRAYIFDRHKDCTLSTDYSEQIEKIKRIDSSL